MRYVELYIIKIIYISLFLILLGFISLDCGLPSNESPPYNEPLANLTYISDANFIQREIYKALLIKERVEITQINYHMYIRDY